MPLSSSWFDLLVLLVVIALVALGARAGWRSGATRFTLALAGLVAGLIAGLMLAAWLVSDRLTPLTHLVADAACVLGCGLIGAGLGARIGDLLGRGAVRLHLGLLDRAGGAVLRGIATLAACAIVAGIFTAFATTSPGAARVADDPVVTRLAGVLPPTQHLAHDLAHTLPSAGPDDLLSLVPAAQDLAVAPDDATLRQVQAADGDSVVKVEASGCDAAGTTSQGSGFVAVSGSGAGGRGALVVTNAHVVHGAGQVSVSGAYGSAEARVVVDDSRADIAVLEVDGRGGPALTLATEPAANGSATVILGHPQDAALTATAAVVLQRLPVAGDTASSGLRESYRLAADVRHGNSGSPLVATSGAARGQVVGVVNALGSSGSGEGFALTLDGVRTDLAVAQATTGTSGVSTGTCLTS